MLETDVAIVGAGPYGLSVASHLRHQGVRCRVFGKAMSNWSEHMPAGMRLKSEGFASSLYDPQSRFTLASYCAERHLPYADLGFPVPVETFINYGIAFQRKYVPDLKTTFVTSLKRRNGGFSLECEDGSQHLAHRVIVATGISYLAQIPAELRTLGSQWATHTSDHTTFDQFKGRDIAVIGAGSSSVDVAAALVSSGANVQLISRRSEVRFHSRHARLPRPFLDRLRAPMTGLGPGWKSWLCTECPLVFHRMPAEFRSKVVKKHLGPAAGWFVREQVEHKVPFHLNSSVREATVQGGRVRLHVENEAGSNLLDFDHVIAGTGYWPDIPKLSFLDRNLVAEIQTGDGYPVLSTNFESSVPGLYFIGPTSARSFGPLMRFAYGAKYTSQRLSRHLSRLAERRLLGEVAGASPRMDGALTGMGR